MHAFLDGRDTPPRSVESSLKKFEEKFMRWVKAVTSSHWSLLRDRPR
ncbi:hypothetical protein ACNKHV_22725 [Shigella flexneri]